MSVALLYPFPLKVYPPFSGGDESTEDNPLKIGTTRLTEVTKGSSLYMSAENPIREQI